MTILRAGTFNVRDRRRDIPLVVKLAVMIRQRTRAPDGTLFLEEEASTIQFDHDPALVTRDYDTAVGDFIPPQHDPAKIVARRRGNHGEKTFGRKEGAERTVTTRGSDVGEAPRTRDLRDSHQQHRATMAAKSCGAPVSRKPSRWPRGRKLQSRNNLRRQT